MCVCLHSFNRKQQAQSVRACTYCALPAKRQWQQLTAVCRLWQPMLEFCFYASAVRCIPFMFRLYGTVLVCRGCGHSATKHVAAVISLDLTLQVQPAVFGLLNTASTQRVGWLVGQSVLLQRMKHVVRRVGGS